MSLIDTITRTMLVKPHAAGYPFIIGSIVATVIFLILWKPLGVLFLFLTLFILYFFRDPIRVVPQQDGLIIAPADGRIISITENQKLPDGLDAEVNEDENFTKISIFLSVLDVHVNRVPVAGEVVKTFYYEGKFLNAELDKASLENERSVALIKTADDKFVGVTQIAGLIARRIITDLSEGDAVQTGHRYGLIRFGSRSDVYIPSATAPLVCVDQRTLGGETVLADLNTSHEKREGEKI